MSLPSTHRPSHGPDHLAPAVPVLHLSPFSPRRYRFLHRTISSPSSPHSASNSPAISYQDGTRQYSFSPARSGGFVVALLSRAYLTLSQVSGTAMPLLQQRPSMGFAHRVQSETRPRCLARRRKITCMYVVKHPVHLNLLTTQSQYVSGKKLSIYKHLPRMHGSSSPRLEAHRGTRTRR